MSVRRRVLFIDANQYLQLFQINSGAALLAPLKKVKEHILITRQIAAEVERNKLCVAQRFLKGQLEAVSAKTIGLPDHLFGIPESELSTLRAQLKQLSADKDSLVSRLEEITTETLKKISASRDDVSVALKEIAQISLSPTEDELRRARERREIGNPPGKPSDPLGDQISWEQLLSAVNEETELWIISSDGDYLTSFGDDVFLNSFLAGELQAKGCHSVRVSSNLLKGLKDFIESLKLPISDLPKGEVAKQIEEDLESPRVSVWRAWEETFSAAQDALRRRGAEPSKVFRAVSLALQRDGLLEGAMLQSLEQLRQRRNDAVHNVDKEIPVAAARLLRQAADEMIAYFKAIPPK